MQKTDEQVQSAVELLARLVAFDTTSAKSNLPLIGFVEAYLGRHGVTSQRIRNEAGTHASLVARIGSGEGAAIGLSGHTDCVPVEGQVWSSRPFALAAKGERLHGRGACDMKGFLACVLAMVPPFVGREGGPPIDLLFSYDEEVGCTGVRPLIARLGKDLPRPAMVIVGVPTDMEVVDAHKSIDAYVTTVTGREAHSSMPQLGANAIQPATALVSKLGRIGADLAKRKDGPRFDPPYATLQVGMIEGGTAPNIVPRQCVVRWQVRALPGADAQKPARQLAKYAETQLLPALRKQFAEASIVTEHVNNVPAYGAGEGSAAVTLAMKLAGRNETRAVSYGTEAGLYELAGIPAVVCGPGSIAQAHAADEYVEEAQLASCLDFLRRLTELS